MMPAIRPMRSVSGVPATITANRSRPCLSEPKGRVPPGGCRARADSGRARSTSTMNEPMTTNSSSARSSSSPTISVGLRRRYRQTDVVRSVHSPASRRGATETTTCSVSVELTSSSPVRDSRVQQRINEIENERREAERHDHPEDDALDEKIIRLANGVVEHRADARIAEDHLDQHRPGGDVPEDQSQRSGLRQ